jgi:hypothetical protein
MTRNHLAIAFGLVVAVVTCVVVIWVARPEEMSAAVQTPAPSLVLSTVATAPSTTMTPASAVASTTPSSATPTAKPATKIVRLAPITKSGAPKTGYAVERGETEVDSCTASPAGGKNVASCSPSAAGADVCWVASDRIWMLCGTDPWEKKLLEVKSTTRLEEMTPVADPAPWGLVLADGAKCRLRNGGSWGGRADGFIGAYSCDRDEKEYVLVNTYTAEPTIKKIDPLWTVRIGPLGDPDTTFPPPPVVAVTTAYFAGTP